MPAEILIYAIVAAGLVLWLRSILGTRHGDERQRPNPFAPQPGADVNKTVARNALAGPGATDALPIEGGALTLSRSSKITFEKSHEATLLEIARQDRGFTLQHFGDGAQDAFAMIVEGFAAGDRDLLKSLLSPSLYDAFDKAISVRQAEGQTMTAEIHAIRKADITDVVIKDKAAYITLRFVADETALVKDKSGTVISGHPDRVQETIDIWTFGRDLRDRDPTWFLFATREEQQGASGIPSA